MAQSSQNVLVQNIEKIVLLIALAILGICVLTTMTGGEPTVKVGNRAVPASKANDTLLEETNSALARIPRPGDVPPVKNWVEVAQASLQISETISPALAITPMTPVVREAGRRPGDGGRRTFDVAEITAKMPIPEKPHVTGSAELRRTDDRENPVKDQLVLHVLSSFPANELNAFWNSEDMFKSYMQPFSARFARVEVQVQELGEDGTWGEPRDVTGAVMTSSERTGQLPVVVPQVPDWDGKPDTPNDKAITAALQALSTASPSWEERIVQPPYWELLNNKRTFRPWTIRIPSWMAESVLAAANVPVRPGTATATGTGTGTTPYSPPPGAFPGPGPGYGPFPGGTFIPPGMTPATATPVRTPVAATNEEKEELPPQLPQFSMQRVAKMMVWIHDEEVGYDKVYRYRVRVSVVNPLLRQSRLVSADDKVSARQALVYSSRLAPGYTDDEDCGWSEWSDRVIVPRQVEMFLVGGSRGNNTVTMRVFARGLGQRVEHSFSVGVGDTIGAELPRDILNPLTRKAEKQDVDFSTGLTLVAIDWGKRLATTDGKGGTLQVTLMDGQGRLYTRIQQADETNPRRAFLAEEVKKQEPVRVTTPTETRPPPKQPVRRPTNTNQPR